MCTVDSDEGQMVCSIFLDLGRRAIAPMQSHPIRVKVSFAVHERKESGLPTRPEVQAIQDLEEAVVEKAEPRGAIFVGAATTGEQRRSIFYVPSRECITEGLLTDVPEARRGKVFVDIEEDPEWAYYREFLYPIPSMYRMMMDERVLRSLADKGDIASIPRRNDHWAYFDEVASRDEFVAWLEKNGYAVEQLIEAGDGDTKHGVQFYHTSDVLPETIHPVIEAIRVAVEDEAGGEYDGWETFVVTEKEKGGGR
jgi:hypothetical protein